ncbi:hypothetical protein SETIT_3G132400v2 [Setaria italica]|uniref:Uncharacterized protein n=1 Tax=Setaria italica TaxID=4555 RepID=A0A368QEF1_SETIT|nr:uncharacterized protein LOC101762806 [Setaria italica]RCV16366.1 hypothetical protein SETIT_3G132400v2 [Setaria italica]
MEAPLLLPVSTAAATSSSSVDIDDITVDAAPAPPAAPSSTPPSTQSIVFRVVAVIAVACASLFAQHEAARGFGIDVVSAGGAGAGADGRRFDLFFVSNGRAERILLHASRGVERALFPDASFPRKEVRRVTVKMAGYNLTAGATVDAAAAPGEYVVSLSPALVSGTGTGADAADAVAAAVRRAVARMWLWDGRGAAPARVTEAMVEYLVSAAEVAASAPLSSSEEEDGEPRCMSARFLRHLEGQREGFVARLNRAMRDRWSDVAVDAALGTPARHACAAYRTATTSSSTGQQDPATTPLAASTSDATRGSSVAT